jgi:hypothetical protein
MMHKRAMARFLDSHKIGSFTEEQLMKLQKSPIDEYGVKHLNILYNYEANIVYCLLEQRGCAIEPCETRL